MSNHYNNQPSNDSKIQDFYNSSNQNGGINILDQRGFCTRNSEESKIKKDCPFITLINDSEMVIKNNNFIDQNNNSTQINYNQNNQKLKNNYQKDTINNRDIANDRISQLSPFNNNITNYQYLTPNDFQINNNTGKNFRDTSNERISSFQNIDNCNLNTQNHFFDERNMFNNNNNNNDFKESNNDRLSQLGKLPNNTAFPINNNQRKFYEIKSMNTRNIKEK